MATNVERRVKSLLAQQLGVGEERVVPDARLVEDLDMTSLDGAQLLVACEEEFGIEVPDEDAEEIETVGDAIDFVTKHI